MREFFKKYQEFVIVCAVVLLAAVVIFVATKESRPQAPSPPESTSIPSGLESSSPSSKTPPPSPSSQKLPGLSITGKPLPGKTYQEVVEIYKDRRFQFDDACQARPSSLTFKNGPEVMFDNRSAGEKVIKLDKIAYKVGPYGFIILTITAPTLPHSVKVDCNQLFNSAIINLQK